jgi:hypothetical protein
MSIYILQLFYLNICVPVFFFFFLLLIYNFDKKKKRYRFICLRSWNLYESMFYSNYFATKLGIWTENGDRNLKKFIAMLGIPLEEAN